MTKAFVIGHPIGHSKSPLIHRYWLETYGIKGEYDAVDVAPRDLAGFAARLRAGEFAGGNVTIPHKEAVMALCDGLDPAAAAIGAVNTLVVDNGTITGSNTDHYGFLANLDAGAPGWEQGLDTAIVLGAGGAARAVLAALKGRGIGRIVLLNRTPERARSLAQAMGGPIVPGGLAEFAAHAAGAGLVVNTSAVGMGGTAFEGLDLAPLPDDAVVNDIVYTPLMTPLLESARARGLSFVDGLGMLFHQAAPGFAAWFGTMPEVTPGLRDHVLGAFSGEAASIFADRTRDKREG